VRARRGQLALDRHVGERGPDRFLPERVRFGRGGSVLEPPLQLGGVLVGDRIAEALAKPQPGA
jgi:hypothetical protein